VLLFIHHRESIVGAGRELVKDRFYLLGVVEKDDILNHELTAKIILGPLAELGIENGDALELDGPLVETLIEQVANSLCEDDSKKHGYEQVHILCGLHHEH